MIYRDWHDLYEKEIDDLKAKVRFIVASFLLLVIPSGVLVTLGVPRWLVNSLFGVGFLVLFGAWALARYVDLFGWAHDEPRSGAAAPRKPKAHVLRAASSGASQAPPVEVMHLSAWPMRIIERMPSVLVRIVSGKHDRPRPAA